MSINNVIELKFINYNSRKQISYNLSSKTVTSSLDNPTLMDSGNLILIPLDNVYDFKIVNVDSCNPIECWTSDI